ncbi:MAG TPA: hypothetical protein DCL61_22385 [Cyanobacteria bacterium UBA12227]|nr:hypothetical protein [Cyanobacteria bacterium UBA12227]HAX85886.1 hypothetical protein [Cyanobacteria bacterium UBA11370]HBY75696.1 hypothetical protein [Cyanobacteria bacterium UBA11148]
MNNTNTSNHSYTTQNPNNGQSPLTFPQPPGKKSPLFLGLIAAITTSVLAGGVYLGYTQWQRNNLQKDLETRLSQIQNLQKSGQFEDCIEQAKAFPSEPLLSRRYPDIYNQFNGVIQECQRYFAVQLLTQAKELAASDQLMNAVQKASQIDITLDSDFYQQAQELIQQWSNEIIARAERQYQLGELEIAVNWAKTIPETVPVYQKAQQRIEYWQKTWTENQEHYEAAQDALNKGLLDKTLLEANQITTLHWQQRVKPIKDRANDDKHLAAAWMAIRNSQWHKAFEEANTVTTEYGKQKSQPILDRVRDENYLSTARSALNNGQWDKAIEETNKVTTNEGKRSAQLLRDRANDEKNLSRARTAFNNGEWDKVIDELNKVKTEAGKEKAAQLKEQVQQIIGLAAFFYLLNELSNQSDIQTSH